MSKELDDILNKAFDYGVQSTLDNLLLRGYNTKNMLEQEHLGNRLMKDLDEAKMKMPYMNKDAINQALLELKAIKESNPSEAMKCLDLLGDFEWRNVKLFKDCFPDLFDPIKQSLLKAQEQEKENEALKEIIKSLFDRGSPLHQYIDKDFGLTIEVDKGISIMHLGKFKGIDLDKKLKEILHNE